MEDCGWDALFRREPDPSRASESAAYPRKSLLTTYDPTMWKRVRERLLSGLGILLMLAWLGGAVAIAVWLVGETGIEVRRKGAVGLVVMIYLVPIGVAVALDEFVIRRVKYGPPEPGRHVSGALYPDQLHALNERLKRRSEGTSET